MKSVLDRYRTAGMRIAALLAGSPYKGMSEAEYEEIPANAHDIIDSCTERMMAAHSVITEVLDFDPVTRGLNDD